MNTIVLAILTLSPALLAAPAPEPQVSPAHVLLPEYDGATVLSTEIRAQADYLEAMGHFAEHASIARINNSIAAEKELENSLKWVSTYFERRAINRAARAKEDPPHAERVKLLEEAIQQRITKHFQDVLQSDVTASLNWLLRSSASRVLVAMYGPGQQSLARRGSDDKLAPDDLKHIRLTEAGRSSLGKSVLLADASQVLAADWPFVLRGPEFDDSRKNFEVARDEFLQQLGSEALTSFPADSRLMAAVDRLCSDFNLAYPRERRLASGPAFASYTAGRRFLQSLAMQVFRAVNTRDRALLSGNMRFDGQTVVDLVNYMYRNGLEFAPPEPGDVRIYQRLFLALRAIYIGLAAEDPANNGKPQDEPAPAPAPPSAAIPPPQ